MDLELQTNSKPKIVIQSIMILYLVVWSISPPLSLDMIYRYGALAAVLIWAALAYSRGYKFQYTVRGDQLYAVLFVVLIIGVSYVEANGSFSNVLKSISYFFLVISFIMMFFYRDRFHEISWILPIVLVLFTVWNFITIAELAKDAQLARKIVRDDPEIYQYLRKGVGGYGLIYSQVCIFPALISWTIASVKHSRILFAIGVTWTTSFIIYALYAGYSIALFASCVGVIILFFGRSRGIIKPLIISAIVFAGVLLAIQYWEGFRNLLLKIFDETKVAQKIEDIVSSSTGEKTVDSIAGRIDRYWASIKSILGYPLTGGMWWGGGGGHSAVLDTFAKYGIFGVMVFIRIFYYVPMEFKRTTDDRFILSVANATLISTIYVSVLDSTPYELVFTSTIVLSIVFYDLIRWRRESLENIMDSEFGPQIGF